MTVLEAVEKIAELKARAYEAHKRGDLEWDHGAKDVSTHHHNEGARLSERAKALEQAQVIVTPEMLP